MKVLLIGAGTMGAVHAASYSTIKDAELVGIADFSTEKAKALAEETGAQAFSSFEEAMELAGEVDVIDICLPTYLHKEFVIKAAEHADSIICEKPLARSLEEAREIIDACKTKGKRLFVGHVVRFFQEYTRIKELVAAGKVGKPGVVRTSRGGVFPVGSENWYADFEKSGGLVLDLLLHDFDYLRGCFGEVKRVFAKKIPLAEQREYALVTLRFQNGVIAHLEGTWAHQGFSSAIEVAGDEGIIDYNSAKSSPLHLVKKDAETSGAGVEVPESPLKASPYQNELAHFIHCIKTGEEPLVTAEDAYRAIEIATAAQTSCDTGEPVELNKQRIAKG
ncbi:Gfo/Idh/MocA family oxidoreductase [Halobacillus salinarum]|uniref:Gfo/Idh/MocA family oxidoreductase n=1 Tax=Halobacillus salinarum TaxID=2932257 RepID=A0ABY4ELW4_9BACI|nr:Gfo/Idh/MocA family oxidoreductase [Halobacillus salinarum]UOQ45442.1 Gfo/Idh/MocA family oxidoreductase [Halobacillus salinarum]